MEYIRAVAKKKRKRLSDSRARGAIEWFGEKFENNFTISQTARKLFFLQHSRLTLWTGGPEQGGMMRYFFAKDFTFYVIRKAFNFHESLSLSGSALLGNIIIFCFFFSAVGQAFIIIGSVELMLQHNNSSIDPTLNPLSCHEDSPNRYNAGFHFRQTHNLFSFQLKLSRLPG